MVIELESVKTHITAPAHPSATGIGRVSGLVWVGLSPVFELQKGSGCGGSVMKIKCFHISDGLTEGRRRVLMSMKRASSEIEYGGCENAIKRDAIQACNPREN